MGFVNFQYWEIKSSNWSSHVGSFVIPLKVAAGGKHRGRQPQAAGAKLVKAKKAKGKAKAKAKAKASSLEKGKPNIGCDNIEDSLEKIKASGIQEIQAEGKRKQDAKMLGFSWRGLYGAN